MELPDFNNPIGVTSDSSTVQSGITAIVNLFYFVYGLIIKGVELMLSSIWYIPLLLILTFIIDYFVVGKVLWQRERTLKRMFVSFLVLMLILTVLGFLVLPILEGVVNWLEGLGWF